MMQQAGYTKSTALLQTNHIINTRCEIKSIILLIKSYNLGSILQHVSK
jgi:hypothetical protein